jgi:flagellar biosynthesis component FlhA
LVVPGGVRNQIHTAFARHLPEIQVLAEEEIADEPRVELFTTIADEEVSRAA